VIRARGRFSGKPNLAYGGVTTDLHSFGYKAAHWYGLCDEQASYSVAGFNDVIEAR
jgi:hypothetical protein